MRTELDDITYSLQIYFFGYLLRTRSRGVFKFIAKIQTVIIEWLLKYHF
jgi:hypothetical protein